MKRKDYLDNIRWITLCFVIVYHIFYIFNSSGVISNINVHGIKEFDSICVFIYPWIMCLLFVVSGVSTRYALQKKTDKEFIKDRFKRIMIPAIIGIFAYGWIAGWMTNYYTDIFAGNGNLVPTPIKYIVWSLIGMGPLWYAHVLFIASLLIVLIRKMDKKNHLEKLFSKINLPILFILGITVWLSSYLLNMPLITVYRFGIYLWVFLLGYYVFSNEKTVKSLERISIPLSVLTLLYGIMFTVLNKGVNFGSNEFLQSPWTNIYVWLVILSSFGISKRYLDFHNSFTKYMNQNNFSFYVLHYTILLIIGFILAEYIKLPFIGNYMILGISMVTILPFLTEVIKRIPFCNKLLLGRINK